MHITLKFDTEKRIRFFTDIDLLENLLMITGNTPLVLQW